MGQITNGTVEYNRRLRTGDFEHKDAKVSLSFTVAEGDVIDLFIAEVGNMAVVQAGSMVGEIVRAVVTEEVAHTKVEEAKRTRAKRQAAADPMMGSSGAAVETTPMASQPAPAEASSVGSQTVPVAGSIPDPMTGQPADVRPTAVVAATAVDPMVGPTSAAVVTGPATGVSQSVPGETTAATVGISDTELTGLISRKVEQLSIILGDAAVPKVIELVEQFVLPPGRATQMTQEQRIEFVARLKTLS